MGSKPYPRLPFSNICPLLCNLLFLTIPKNLVRICTSPYSGYIDNRQDQRISSEAETWRNLLTGGSFPFSYCNSSNLTPTSAGCSCGQIVQIDVHVLTYTGYTRSVGQNYTSELHFQTKEWLAELWEHWSHVPSKIRCLVSRGGTLIKL